MAVQEISGKGEGPNTHAGVCQIVHWDVFSCGRQKSLQFSEGNKRSSECDTSRENTQENGQSVDDLSRVVV